MKLKDKSLKLIIIGISTVLYIASWCLPVAYVHSFYYLGEMHKIVWGIDCLIGGGLAFMTYGPSNWGHITWIANLFFISGIIAFIFNRFGAYLWAFLALIPGVAFWFCKDLILSENGRVWIIYHRGLGYYIWVLSFVVLFIGTLLYAYSTRKSKKHG